MNKTINIVMIDDNDVVTGSVKEYFKKNALINVVNTFNNGKDGLEYLINNKNLYDLIILDILLPETDGIKIIEELQKRGISKRTIILSSYKDDFTIRKTQSLGIDFYMLKPFNFDSLEERIKELFDRERIVGSKLKSDVEIEVTTMLHDLGIPSHIRGYEYIREGILLLYQTPRIITYVTKEIYPQIALKFDSTPTRVERAIRNAIDISWTRGDVKLMDELFGNSVDFDRSKPTNSEFLTTIADRLKLNKRRINAYI